MESFLLLAMDHGEANKKSIVDIFNSMEYEEKQLNATAKNSNEYFNNEMENLIQTLKNATLKEPKSFDNSVELAVKAQTKWKGTAALARATLLHKIWKALTEKSASFSKLSSCTQNEFSNLVAYFDYYSDVTLQMEDYTKWKSAGVVLVVLSNYSPFTVLGATVPAALAAGCSLIILAPDKMELFALFLQETMSTVGLPDGLFNVVKESAENVKPLSGKIHKVIYCGSLSKAQNIYQRSLSKSFSFLCPNNTTALILESCDLSAAADKIFSETWGSNSCNMWAVSTAVVQEAVYQKFLDKLKFRMEQFRAENKNSLKFKSKKMLERITKVIMNATKAGATVEKCWSNENEWGPTVLINYQDQQDDPDVPVLKVLICRTAKEGVALVNNCRFNLGTSVWTEVSSEALEIASKLICPNKWINCHGIIRASVPFQPIGSSGNCVFGGCDGMFEFISFSFDDPVEGNKHEEDRGFHPEKLSVLQMAAFAQRAFNKWHTIKTKRKYLKDVASALQGDKELSTLFEVITTCAHYGNINISESNSDEFFVVHKKVPLGVIVLFINTPNFDIVSVASLITPAIAFGNAIIVVLREENSLITSMEKYFNKYLPKNVFNVIIGGTAAVDLASDPTVQAIWLYDESSVSAEYLQMMRTHSARTLKSIWIIPKSVSICQNLFWKKCLRNTVVWLTKVDQYP